MTRWHRLALCPVLFTFLLPAPVPAAEESPLAQIPAGAPIVVSVRGVKRTTDRLVTMIKNAVPDLGPTVQAKIGDFLKEGFFEGRKLQGLADDGPVFLVFPSMPKPGDDEPTMAFVVRVTDYKAFRDGLLTDDERKTFKEDKAGYEVGTMSDRDTYFVKRNGYAVVTADKKTAEEFAKKARGQGLAGKLTGNLARRLLEPDVAAYVDMVAVNKEFGAQIKTGKDLFENALERAPDAGLASKDVVEMVKALVGGLFQAIEDSRAVFVSVDFRPQGLAFHFGVDIAPDSKSNRFLKSLKVTALTDLNALPAGYASYAAAGFGPEGSKLFQPFLKLLAAAPDEEENKAQAKAIQDALEQLLASGPREYLTAASIGSRAGGLQVWSCADPQKAVAAQLKLLQALSKGGQFQFAALKGKPVVRPAAATYKGAKFNFASLKWDLDKMMENVPGGEEAAKAMKQFTGEGMDFWFGVAGGRYVQVMAKDWKDAEAKLNDYLAKKDPVGGPKHKAFQQARGNLPREATFLSLTKTAPIAEAYGRMMYGMLKAQGFPVKEPPPPAQKIPPSYLGMALVLRAGQGGFDLWVPGGAARDFRRVFEPMFKMNEDD